MHPFVNLNQSLVNNAKMTNCLHTAVFLRRCFVNYHVILNLTFHFKSVEHGTGIYGVQHGPCGFAASEYLSETRDKRFAGL